MGEGGGEEDEEAEDEEEEQQEGEGDCEEWREGCWGQATEQMK